MRTVRRVTGAVLLIVWGGACGSSGDGDGGVDYTALCEGFTPPARDDASACAAVDLSQPDVLASCLEGSGHAGVWAVDADGLPAYDLTVEHRCDPAGYLESEVTGERHGPVHLVGNGRGTVAVAHASGAVELYSQDRGPKWLNKVESWRDPDDGDFPLQVGGGFNYLVVDGEVRSTRFDDMPVGEAIRRQTRRFGVGYVETVTTFDDLVVTRRVMAPDVEARALVSEVTIENLTEQYREVGLVELWDVNVQELTPEETTDLADRDAWHDVVRRRRALMDAFEQTASYSEEQRTVRLDTTARSLPADVMGRDDVSEVDWFVDPIYLAPIDSAEPPDAVWLRDGELWDSAADRAPPAALAGAGDGSSRDEVLDGADQHALMAMRIAVQVPVEAPVVRRFAFGYAPIDHDVAVDLAVLRAQHGELSSQSATSWRDRLVWLAVDGADHAGAMQREVAWSSYAAQAAAVYDEYSGARVLGPGGAQRFVRGLEGGLGDLALLAESMLLVDPALARDTLRYALSAQEGKSAADPWRLPYAVTGVGAAMAASPDRRTDAYFLLPAAVARYAAVTRDLAFLDSDAPYWPRSTGENDTVLAHLAGALAYAEEDLGTGARGFVAMGASDSADDALALAGEGGDGVSSLYNAGAAVLGFPLVADLIEARDAELAAGYRAVADQQRALLLEQGWNGSFVERGFAGGGEPLAADVMFLEPQLFPILAGAVTGSQRDALLDLVAERLGTSAGALGSAPGSGGVRPATGAWLTEAEAQRSPERGWASFWLHSLANRAAVYPDLWCGIWTGPRSFGGPDLDLPGGPDVRLDPAVAMLPALSSHVPAATLRSVMALVGISGAGSRLRITPRVPGETFALIAPRLHLTGSRRSLGGAIEPSAGGSVILDVALPSGLTGGSVVVTVNETEVAFTREGDRVSFELPLTRDAVTRFEVTGG